MEYQPQQNNTFMTWLKESVTLKLFFIGALILALLIPSSLIQDLITERQTRQEEVEKDISDKWSAAQLIQGPVLVIPYKRQFTQKDATNKDVLKEVTENLYVLPDALHMDAKVIAEKRDRGVFETVVYNTQVKIWGDFKAEAAKQGITPEQLLLNKAKLTFSISDLKGLKTNPIVNAAGRSLKVESVFNEKGLFSSGLQTCIDLTSLADKTIPFSFTLDLKGSQELQFLHSGKSTDVAVAGNWPSPSFDGRYLPDERHVNDKGFSAKWRMLHYNRPFAQQWVGNDSLINKMAEHQDALFGVKLKVPVDQYQKTMRTSKYAILIILLTFISLFLTEMISKQRVHVFNYVLIGAAMVIYYTLLLSLSEKLGFDAAYLVASIATIALVAKFIASLLKNNKAAALFAAILAMFYVFIYVIIQLEDLALLIGSIALFVIIGALMYFSRKINWDK